MSKYRRAAKVDENQNQIVSDLRKLGATVQTGMDDILVGFKGNTFWFEIKSREAVSKKTGKILESQIKKSQKKIRSEWCGQYDIVHSFEQILAVINK